jgi:hypothetical protein
MAVCFYYSLMTRYDASGNDEGGTEFALPPSSHILQLLDAGGEDYAIGVDDSEIFAGALDNPGFGNGGLFAVSEAGWIAQPAYADAGGLTLVGADPSPLHSSDVEVVSVGNGFFPCAVDALGDFVTVAYGSYARFDPNGKLISSGGDLSGGRWQSATCGLDDAGALTTAATLNDGSLEVAHWIVD